MNLSEQDRAWERAIRILCIRLDTLGDVIMTGPAVRGLKESVPDRHVTLLSSPLGAEAGRLLPGVDEVVVYEAPWMKATARRVTSEPDLLLVEQLRAGRYDAAVIFTVYSQSALPAALLCYLAGIPMRLAHCRENPYQLLTHWVREIEPDTCLRHEVRRQLDLVRTVGARPSDERLALRIPEDAFAAIDRLLGDIVGRDERWVIVHPGASAPSRRYPAESFGAVAESVARAADCTILFTGTEPERDLIEGIRSSLSVRSHSLAGLLDLPSFAALLARAPLVISNNTGAVHIAAAVGTPVVDLYALTNPQHTPWQVPHRVLFHDVPCKYCYKSICPEGHHDCLRRVTPNTVVHAAMELLEQATASPWKGVPLVHPRY